MKTLVLVDVQNDFMPGGALPVKEGDHIVPVINRMLSKFDLVVATQDWHPQNHKSFAVNNPGKKEYEVIDLNGLEQKLWPAHCVQGSSGAEFHPKLETNTIEAIFRKGMDPEIDSYSGFYDNGHKKSTGLAGYLRERDVDEVWFCGLAADFCVYYSILDAIKEGFRAVLIDDATRAIDSRNFDNLRKELEEKGVRFVSSKSI